VITELVRTDPWPLRRQRTEELAIRYPFAGQLLSFYRALLPIQERVFHAAAVDHPSATDLPAYVVDRAMPDVIDVTVARGPRQLRDGVVERFCSADLPELVRHWLRGDELIPVEAYLVRASAGPVLEAMDEPIGTVAGERCCPSCGGLPQLSYFAITGEALVTGPRYLLCSRCGHAWVFSRMVCAGCGERASDRLAIYREEEQFPHLRIDACQTCHQYLLTLDLRRDTAAVPLVDELAALPLDLYARERGFTKIVPNLLGN
jgi:formate dehydrogenase maturation protein FdhE